MSALSGLTKKTIYADKLLATILGVSEGDRVSYADLTRGLHKYIKDHNLKNLQASAAGTTPVQLVPSSEPGAPGPQTLPSKKSCIECRAEIPAQAVFCDLCGARQ